MESARCCKNQVCQERQSFRLERFTISGFGYRDFEGARAEKVESRQGVTRFFENFFDWRAQVTLLRTA